VRESRPTSDPALRDVAEGARRNDAQKPLWSTAALMAMAELVKATLALPPDAIAGLG
jgi:hypothetical protein